MSDLSELESRITVALDRIRAGLDRLGASGGDSGLQTDLAEERAANAALEERVAALKDRQDTQVAQLNKRVATQQDQLMKLDAELQQLRASNAQLRKMNGQLRETVTKGLAPELHNAAVAAEIEALQSQRSADAAEVDAILAELQPLIAEARHAAG